MLVLVENSHGRGKDAVRLELTVVEQALLSLDDARWKDLLGGYKAPYDAAAPLRRMEAGEDVWEELWNELHHQGDVDTASYTAVPHLVRLAKKNRDFNLYALVGVIEVERHRKTNPPIPDWLLADDQQAWRDWTALALQDLTGPCDSSLVQPALLQHLDDSDIDELAEERLAWSELYAIILH
ncbi:MAG: hypothetical protein U0931_08265 [Vulcanimicrobiota bacterium]